MRVDPLGVLIAALAAAGGFNVMMSVADGMAMVLERIFVFSRRRLWIREQEDRARFDPYGLDHVPWDVLRLGAALAGVGLAALLFWERGPYLAALGLGAGYIPSLVRVYLLRRRMAVVDGQVRHLIRALGSSLRPCGGLSPALVAIAPLMDNPVGQRLAFHLGVKSGQEALEALAADFRSERLAELARRLGEAGIGIRAPEEILQETMEAFQRDSLARAREAIGAAPIRLLIPMLFFLIPPILVLILYPPVARLIALISHAGSGGVGW